jgi:hypothetical protein
MDTWKINEWMHQSHVQLPNLLLKIYKNVSYSIFGMFITSLHKEWHRPSSNGSLTVTAFLHCLYYEAVNFSGYIELNGMIMDEQWIWKDVEKSGCGQTKVLLKNLSQESKCPCQDINRASPKYMSQVLLLQPAKSIIIIKWKTEPRFHGHHAAICSI